MSGPPPARRLRVAHVVPSPDFARLILRHDVTRLARRVDSTIIGTRAEALEPSLGAVAQLVPIPINRKIAPLSDLVALFHLVRHLRRGQFDIVAGYTPKGALLATLAGCIARVPVRLAACRGLLYVPGMSPLSRALFRLVDRLTNACATRTVFVSGADMRYSVEQGLCRPGRAWLSGSGIDLHWFDPHALPEQVRADTRKRLGVNGAHPLLLTVGRFVPDKGYPELARALASVRKLRPDMRALWIAPAMHGETGVLSPALLEDAGIADVVTLVPGTDDLRPYYLAADLLVHPSRREGVPRVVMEAGAMGLPVVASDIPGCREILGDDPRWLFPILDPDAMAAAILRALDDAAGRRSHAQQTRITILERFDQDDLSERIWTLYQQLHQGTRRHTQ